MADTDPAVERLRTLALTELRLAIEQQVALDEVEARAAAVNDDRLAIRRARDAHLVVLKTMGVTDVMVLDEMTPESIVTAFSAVAARGR